MLFRYDWLFLQSLVVAGFVGWMAYTADFVLAQYVHLDTIKRKSAGTETLFFFASFGLFAAKFVIEHAPITYYLYAAFPCFFWSRLLANAPGFSAALRSASISDLQSGSLAALWTILSLEMFVYGFFDRRAWTAGFLVLGLIWPIVGTPKAFKEQNKSLGAAWTVCCVLTSAFTLLPVEKGEHLGLM